MVFADIIKNLEMGRLPWTIWGSQCKHKGFYKMREGESGSEREVVKFHAADFEDGGWGHEPNNASNF